LGGGEAGGRRPLHVFDLGGVLVDVDFERFVQAVLARDPSAEPAALRAFCAGPRKLGLDKGRVTPLAFLAALVQELAPSAGPADSLLHAWTDIFLPVPRTAEVLASLSPRSELWLLSDTDPAHFAWILDHFPCVRGFDRFLLSYARGMVKGEPGAFAPLVEQVHAGRRVRFYDDRPDNVAAARAVGLDARLFEGWDSWEPLD